jgi:hypothetical protein
MVTRALTFRLFSLILSYLMGIPREHALSPMLTTMALVVILPRLVRGNP